MRRLLVFVALITIVGGGAYLYLFKKKEVESLLFPPAKSAREAADKFRDAIKERNYKKAARYCTKAYAEILTKSHEAGNDLAGRIDDFTSRLIDDGLMTDELKYILFLLDPFPKDFNLILSNETDKEAAADFQLMTSFDGKQDYPLESWHIDLNMVRSLYQGLPGRIRIVKEGEGDKAEWKLDVPTPAALQTSSTKLREHYKDYVNPLKKISVEVKNDPTTKSAVTKRFKELLTEAIQN